MTRVFGVDDRAFALEQEGKLLRKSALCWKKTKRDNLRARVAALNVKHV